MCYYWLTHSSTKIHTHNPWFAWPASKPLQHNCFPYNPYLISVAALGGGQVYQNLIITLKLFELFEVQNILWSQVLWNCLKGFGLRLLNEELKFGENKGDTFKNCPLRRNLHILSYSDSLGVSNWIRVGQNMLVSGAKTYLKGHKIVKFQKFS